MNTYVLFFLAGKKAYGDYTLKEVSKLFVKEEWNNIGNAPQFDIGNTMRFIGVSLFIILITFIDVHLQSLFPK